MLCSVTMATEIARLKERIEFWRREVARCESAKRHAEKIRRVSLVNQFTIDIAEAKEILSQFEKALAQHERRLERGSV